MAASSACLFTADLHRRISRGITINTQAHSVAAPTIVDLNPIDPDSEELNVIIETLQGNRNKFSYDEQLNLFKLGGVLPAGAVFPFDFGFLPSTIGGDEDPLDILVLMDALAFAGCLVRARLIGAIEAEQTEDGETTRNDRLIAAAGARNHQEVQWLDQLSENLVSEIEHFFVSYNAAKASSLGRLVAPA